VECALDFGLTKRCNCPQRLWTKGCPHSWHYAFKWKRERFRSALDDVLRRHVDSKTEALREVEKIYDAVRAGAFGVKPAAQTLGELGDIYFEKSGYLVDSSNRIAAVEFHHGSPPPTSFLYGTGSTASACSTRRWKSLPRDRDVRRLNRNVNSSR
jgi:hypothetical protein